MKKTRLFNIALLLVTALFVQASLAQTAPGGHTLNLPEGAKARLGKGWISEIAYSPDGTRLAVGSAPGIWLYDTQTGEELSLLTGHTDGSGASRLVRMDRPWQAGVLTRPSVYGMWAQVALFAHSPGIRIGSGASRLVRMDRPWQAGVRTIPSVYGMWAQVALFAHSPGIRIGSGASRLVRMDRPWQAGVMTIPSVYGMWAQVALFAHSPGIRIGSGASRLVRMDRPWQAGVWTRPSVYGMWAQVALFAHSPGIRIGSGASRLVRMDRPWQAGVSGRYHPFMGCGHRSRYSHTHRAYGLGLERLV